MEAVRPSFCYEPVTNRMSQDIFELHKKMDNLAKTVNGISIYIQSLLWNVLQKTIPEPPKDEPETTTEASELLTFGAPDELYVPSMLPSSSASEEAKLNYKDCDVLKEEKTLAGANTYNYKEIKKLKKYFSTKYSVQEKEKEKREQTVVLSSRGPATATRTTMTGELEGMEKKLVSKGMSGVKRKNTKYTMNDLPSTSVTPTSSFTAATASKMPEGIITDMEIDTSTGPTILSESSNASQESISQADNNPQETGVSDDVELSIIDDPGSSCDSEKNERVKYYSNQKQRHETFKKSGAAIQNQCKRLKIKTGCRVFFKAEYHTVSGSLMKYQYGDLKGVSKIEPVTRLREKR